MARTWRDTDFLEASNIAPLEESVAAQAAGSAPYDARACRGLLKLYQQNPARLSVDTVVLLLARALAALPEPDFLLAMYLVPQPLHAHEAVAALAELERLLQMAKFPAFWAKAKEPGARALLDRVAGFDAAVREYVGRVVARTYQKIDADVLAGYLDQVSARPARAAGYGRAAASRPSRQVCRLRRSLLSFERARTPPLYSPRRRRSQRLRAGASTATWCRCRSQRTTRRARARARRRPPPA
jgi:hypothetical protein